MEFSIKNGNPEKQRHDCVVVGIFEGRKLSDAAKNLDDISNKAISAVLKSGDMEG
ncbi:MAG TPA: M17 family peptidase N-terminal domain-containing protein, partial [Methylotenera sp.]|nr:M17 family peptidase N-terminal domain-containing protein [Methylotenera sp.]